MATHKVFPITQGVACQLKWTWNTIRLQEATSACCHRVNPVTLTPENFDQIHNHPTWVQHREMQLRGQFPQDGCEYCERIEQAGGTSDRLLHNREQGVSPPELDSDAMATRVTPRMLEVFINNRCNLACIYCDESNSTRIHKENQKFGYDIPGVHSDHRIATQMIPRVEFASDYDRLLSKFFEYLESKYQDLRKLNVLGGEPFYQKEFFQLMDFVIARKHPDLDLTVVSNLMVSRSVLEEFVDRMKQALIGRRLKRLSITASLDCMGPAQEYLRHGIDLDTWTENFEYLAQHKWLYLTVNNTITSLSIKTTPDLLVYINGIKKHRPVHLAFGVVDGRPHLHPSAFGGAYFVEDFDRIIALMDTSSEWARLSVDYIQGIKSSLSQGQQDHARQRLLACYLDEIDRRRNTDWKLAFPWLHQHLEEHNDVV